MPFASLDYRLRGACGCLRSRSSKTHHIGFRPQAELSRLTEIHNSLAVFCMATYGEGDPTDNAQDFYDWLQQGEVDLSGVKYTVSPSVTQASRGMRAPGRSA